VKIRIKKLTDPRHPLVYDSWLRYWSSSNALPRGAVDTGGRAAIERILSRPSTEVRTAVDSEDSNKIYGLAVVDPSLKMLSWIYVKKEFREYGVARALLHDLPEVRAWWIGKGANLISKVSKVSYEPLLLITL
jgi:hypothetical protein